MRHKSRIYVLLCAIWLFPLLSACGEMQGVPSSPTQVIPMRSAAPMATSEEMTVPTPMAPMAATATSTPSPTPETPATATSSPAASSTAEPAPPSPSPAEVLVWETTISIPSYPYEPYLRQGLDAQHGVAYLWLDRVAYGEPAGASTSRTFRAIVLENRYLRLTVVPDLGGRIYGCVFKPTGQNIFYRNEVLKPTSWGPLNREQNWWLAAGGMEWAFPVHEHGYEWGVPWTYSIERSTLETVVTVRDSAATDRPQLNIGIALAPDKAYFAVRPRITNPTDLPITYQYWTNAMLTLGGPSMSPNVEFMYPTGEVLVHSAGPRSGLPDERSRISWPEYEGRDMARYYNWTDWLGFFVPQPTQDFVGAYNHDTDIGVARIFPRQEVPGVKLFAWGQGSPRSFEYTDDGSQYFEIWGGPNRSFWPEDDNRLGPGESKGWTEYWYPFFQIGGLDFANREAVLSLGVRAGSLLVGVATTSQQEGTVVLMVQGQELYAQAVDIGPDSPFVHQLPLPAGAPATARVSLRFLRPDGHVLAWHDEDLHLP